MELFTRWHAWETARADIAASGADIGLDGLDKAVAAAERWHGDQRRPTGAPYVEHLLEALEVLVRGAGVTAPAVLSAAILHDAVEDTPATLADVEAGFGPEVTELVDWVTKPPATGTGRQAKAPPGPPTSAAERRPARGGAGQARRPRQQRADPGPDAPGLPAPLLRRDHHLHHPLAEDEPWFRDWYSSWRRRFAHLQ